MAKKPVALVIDTDYSRQEAKAPIEKKNNNGSWLFAVSGTLDGLGLASR